MSNLRNPPPSLVARCLFCSRTARRARRLVAVPGGHVCDVCVGACAESIYEADLRLVATALPKVVAASLDLLCCVCETIVQPDESVTVPGRGGPVCHTCAEALADVWRATGAEGRVLQ